jgi:hypothetical protein
MHVVGLPATRQLEVEMATIIGGVAASHTPTISFA